jgi:predicted anti-sigma-YlaC factor YlaD
MECARIQDELLESLIEPRPAAVQAMIDAHLPTCATCERFAATQARLDAGLRAVLQPAAMSPRVRALVRERIRRDGVPTLWPDYLPDLVHFASCGIVTMVALVMLPFSAATVIAVGGGMTMISHAALNAARGSLDAAGDAGS